MSLVKRRLRSGWLDGTVPVRLAILLDMAGWAWVLAEPDDTFKRGHQYDLMAQWASEPRWAVLMAAAAIGLLACARLTNRFVRAGIVAFACTLQAAIAVSFAGSATPSTGTLTHVGIALLASWLIWRELVR